MNANPISVQQSYEGPPPPYEPAFPDYKARAEAFLSQHEFPTGLMQSIIASISKVPLRFLIVDDSGSMEAFNDGHLLYGKGVQTKVVPCTRWAELVDSVKFSVGLAEAAGAATEIRFLNGFAPTLVGIGDGGVVRYFTIFTNNLKMIQSFQYYIRMPEAYCKLWTVLPEAEHHWLNISQRYSASGGGSTCCCCCSSSSSSSSSTLAVVIVEVVVVLLVIIAIMKLIN